MATTTQQYQIQITLVFGCPLFNNTLTLYYYYKIAIVKHLVQSNTYDFFFYGYYGSKPLMTENAIVIQVWDNIYEEARYAISMKKKQK